MLSAVVIAFDPVWSGLAWALVFGMGTSAALSLFVVPILYAMVAPHATHTPATHVPMPAGELVTQKEYQPA